MAQGTLNITDSIAASLRLIQHSPIPGGESEGEQVLFPGPQANMGRLWDLYQYEAQARAGPAGAVEAELPDPPLRPDDLSDAEIGNLSAVLVLSCIV